MNAPTKPFVETYWKVVHTGLDGDGDQVHAELPCDGRVLAEIALEQIREWQDDNELPVDATILTRRGCEPWRVLSRAGERIEVPAHV
ncbi:hypothetical protein [Streptosporangium sp. CA-115845]|uniref:hypothetical protein n=1 Tax=Streptosporangium sp. CA-115845 TaxID=3240071 RepID=UPI003D90730A